MIAAKMRKTTDDVGWRYVDVVCHGARSKAKRFRLDNQNPEFNPIIMPGNLLDTRPF